MLNDSIFLKCPSCKDSIEFEPEDENYVLFHGFGETETISTDLDGTKGICDGCGRAFNLSVRIETTLTLLNPNGEE